MVPPNATSHNHTVPAGSMPPTAHHITSHHPIDEVQTQSHVVGLVPPSCKPACVCITSLLFMLPLLTVNAPAFSCIARCIDSPLTNRIWCEKGVIMYWWCGLVCGFTYGRGVPK